MEEGSETPIPGSFRTIANICESHETKTASLIGIVIDTTRAYKTLNSLDHVLQLRVIDHTVSEKREGDKFFVITCFDGDLEKLPSVIRAGELIRVHKLKLDYEQSTRVLRGGIISRKNFYSRWAIHNSDPHATQSILSSSSEVMDLMTEVEKQRIQYLQHFASSYFQENDGLMMSRVRTLDQTKRDTGDFDLLCQITKIDYVGHEAIFFHVRDSSARAILKVDYDRSYVRFHEDNIVRIRSVKAVGDVTHQLEFFGKHSSMLKLPNNFKLSQNLLANLVESQTLSEGPQSIQSSELNAFSKISPSSHHHAPLVRSITLSELLQTPFSYAANRYRVNVSLIKAYPSDICKAVRLYCSRCHRAYHLGDLKDDDRCPGCLTNYQQKLIYQMFFCVTDFSLPQWDATVILSWVTYDDNGVKRQN